MSSYDFHGVLALLIAAAVCFLADWARRRRGGGDHGDTSP